MKKKQKIIKVKKQNNIKKTIIKSSIGLVFLGGISTAIGIPLANNIKNKTNVIKKVDLEEVAYTDADGKKWTFKELINISNDKKNIDKSIITDVIKSTIYYLYEKEQKNSFDEQKRSFKYEWYKKNKDKNRLESKSSLNNNEEKELKNVKKKMTELEKKVTWLEKNKENKKIDYNSSSFKKKYPKILPSINSLEKKQGKIFDDEKKAFVENFKTLAEGEKEWLEQMKKKYQGSSSKNEAISKLVFDIIKNDALKRFKLSIIKKYTVEMENAKYKDETTPIYPFLNGLTNINNFNSTRDKYKTLYFVGSDSYDKDLIRSNLDINGKIIKTLKNKKIAKMRHLLIGAKPNEKGSTLNWKIEKKTIKNLFREYRDLNQTKYMIDLLDENLFKEINEEKTNFFIKNASDDVGSAKINGSLGTDAIMNLLADKVPGFIAGVLFGHKSNGNNQEGINLLTSLKDELKTLVWGNKKSDGTWPEERKSLKAMHEFIDEMPKEEFEEKFGKLFKNLFSYGNDGSKISYNLGNNSYLTISKFGIHIINIKDYSSANEIKKVIDDDIKLINKEQNTQKSEFKYDVLFKNTYTNNNIIRELLENNEYKEHLKTSYEKNKKDKKPGDLVDYIDDDKTKKIWSIVLNEIETENDNFEKTLSLKNLQKVWFKTKLGDFINKNKINKIYKNDINNKIQKIYEKTLILANIKKESD